MSVSSTLAIQSYDGNGSTSTPYPIDIDRDSDDDLYLRVDGVATSDFTVSPDGFRTGTAIAPGQTLVIHRVTPRTQVNPFPSNTTPAPEDVANALDKLTFAVQELSGDPQPGAKALKFPIDEPANFLTELPLPSERLDSVLYFDAITGETSLKTIDELADIVVDVLPEAFQGNPGSDGLDGNDGVDGIQTPPLTLTLLVGTADAVTGYALTSIPVYFKNGATTIKAAFIPGNVTLIDDFAFASCYALTSVTLSNGITTINGSVFAGCTALPTIKFPNSVTAIGTSALGNCTALASVTLPTALVTLSNNTFTTCTTLTTLTIPASVTTIGSNVFNGCTALNALTIPIGVTSVGGFTFNACTALTTISSRAALSAFSATSLAGSSIANIYVRTTDASWMAGVGQTIGGKTGITVYKTLP